MNCIKWLKWLKNINKNTGNSPLSVPSSQRQKSPRSVKFKKQNFKCIKYGIAAYDGILFNDKNNEVLIDSCYVLDELRKHAK